ncbi:membrane-bound acyltransferase YfiQ involved in biofilm formation [Melghirimyces profundicolus]|uniref:Membrane-bound acyltransferase YfiQ involved in biofilm formation n=1 Tax=Melghirimyces profundicolus TaxID=1242148 RepID=A0A2T6BSQ1_9BACL|nr:acyltransferase family protein [Melghirimyces profundicolus]PTX59056.1 membrane-bound acyltransferase YfiQ involved in biofilm formation [Melghirimyces profundicolus]
MNHLKRRSFIEELFFVRAIACLCVVLIHAISANIDLYDLTPLETEAFRSLQLAMMFATPLFICISELLLAHAYPDRTPTGFWGKRIRFILIPYIAIGLLYTILYYEASFEEFWSRAVDIVVFGRWNGYFVLIIFQFYFLHRIFIRYMKDWPPVPVLVTSFGINFLYLAVVMAAGRFDLVDPALLSHHKLPFPGWLFYFTAAYYIGRNLGGFREWIRLRWRWVGWSFFVCMAGVLLLKMTGLVHTASSKRVDMLLYTVAALGFLFGLAMRLRRIPAALVLISRLSYGIYLLHPLAMMYVGQWWLSTGSLPYAVSLFLLFSAGVVVPGILTWLLNLTDWGPYLVGKIGSAAPGEKGYRTARVT